MTGPGLSYLTVLPPWNGKGGFTTDSVSSVAKLWGNPQDQVKSIHIAGTNGKGSVATFLSAILGAEGYSVGLTTSPHLSKLNERVVINGLPVDDEVIDASAEELRQITSTHGIELSFFEAITLIFFDICRNCQVDWMVVEVGLGGRLDATNIIKNPTACAITSISMDHAEILGSTTKLIAKEKAGIVKAGVPVVLGKISDDSRTEIERIAAEIGAPVCAYGREFNCSASNPEGFVYSDSGGSYLSVLPALRGAHQGVNAGVAAQLAKLIGISDSSISAGVSAAFWPGRLEVVNYQGREIVFDAGHNPAGIQTLVEFINTEYNQRVDLCFGVINTKDWRVMVDQLCLIAASWRLLKPQSGAAVSCSSIAEYLSSIGVSADIFEDDYQRCFSSFKESTDSTNSNVERSPKPPIVVVGSIYLIGAVRELVGAQNPPLWEQRHRHVSTQADRNEEKRGT